MKKYFYSLLAATGLLLATSCSQDDLVNETGSESKVVTFKVNLPDQAASRAVGEGANATALIFAMYEEGSDEVVIAKDTYEDDTDNDQTISRKDGGSFEVKVPMAKDIKYDLLFLAYNPENCAFNIASDPENTNLKALTFKNKLTANLDAYDAFVGVKKSQGITASGTNSVTLTRPFAQVNAATSDKDDAALLKSAVTTSEFRIYGVPSTYNVFKKEATGTMEVVFEKSAIPANETITKDDKTYNYLTLAYVLAGGVEQASTHKAEFLFYREDGKQVSSLYFENFPIQRNYRTNVLGNLLTQEEDYTVTIQEGFAGSDLSANPDEANRIYTVTDEDGWKEVAAILAESGEDTISVKLGAGMGRAASNEIAVTIPTTIHKDKTVFLDLNGYTLSHTKECSESYQMINNEGTLTIVDSSEGATGKISFKDTGDGDSSFGWGSYTIVNSGTLVVESGTIENISSIEGRHMHDAIDNHTGATLTINGGEVKCENYVAIRLFAANENTDNKVIINGGTITGKFPIWPQKASGSAPKATLDINGGTIDGNLHLDSSENFTLTADNANFVVSSASGLKNALGLVGEGCSIKLKEDIDLTESQSIPAGATVTLDLNGKIITGTDNATGSFGLITLNPGSNLTIKSTNANGRITLTAKNNRAWNAYSSVVSNQRATLIVGENVVIEHLGGTDMAYGIDNLTNTGAEHAKTTIDGATVKSTYRAIRQFLNSSAEGVNNELYVNSGVIEGSNKSIWMQDANAKANPGKLVVNENVELRGDVYLSVTEGSTEWPVEVSIAKTALQGESKVSTNDNVPEKLILAEIDGIYTIIARPYVATIGETGYYTLEAALADVSDGTVENAVIELAEGEYTMPEPTLNGKTFTIKGTKETVIDVSNVDARDQFVTGATLVFDGVTLNFGKVNYMGFANTASLAYKNCKINGLQFLFGPSVSFENCEFDSNGAEHCVWTYGAKNVSFTECNFTYGDRGINCYGDNDVDGGKQTVNFNECTFATENIQSKGAVEINSYYFSVGIEVNMEGCTAPAYGEMAYVSEWDDTKGAKTTINIK